MAAAASKKRRASGVAAESMVSGGFCLDSGDRCFLCFGLLSVIYERMVQMLRTVLVSKKKKNIMAIYIV